MHTNPQEKDLLSHTHPHFRCLIYNAHSTMWGSILQNLEKVNMASLTKQQISTPGKQRIKVSSQGINE